MDDMRDISPHVGGGDGGSSHGSSSAFSIPEGAGNIKHDYSFAYNEVMNRMLREHMERDLKEQTEKFELQKLEHEEVLHHFMAVLTPPPLAEVL